MASTLGALFQDQNLSVHSKGASVVGKGDALKTKKKGGLGGRKPLGDLSNSGKPAALTQASKKQSSKVIICGDASNNKGLSKASDKVQTSNRNALRDISNTRDAPAKNNTKQRVMPKQPVCPDNIAEEGFLHNHQECMKAQDIDEIHQFRHPSKYMDLEEIPEDRNPWQSDNLDSPPPCKTPKSPNGYTDSLLIWEDCDFKLANTP
ncbi:hypothetical protein D8674_008781 [Pyrus ussuriensis x Pyrus communis]|uniref:Protein PATRONUS 1-like n=1 Tax=Pyrus ussuriensis x Pyrus communis TaxID=2448454 RepID=A0A5N5HYJ9_9ROSA|nr:hypothetical protein D8674_008781 [Pyrus ussuriensis x Pyrus communis]